eukprot:gene11101-12367_t
MAFQSCMRGFRRSLTTSRYLATASSRADPIGLLVTVDIKPERVNEFLEVMKIDSVDSTTKENGGCLKFDVMRHGEAANRFTFYEVYRDEAAVAFHKSTSHYQKWANFKNSGAVLSQSVQKVTVSLFNSCK